MTAPRASADYRITDVTLIDVEKGIAIPGQTVKTVGDGKGQTPGEG